MDNTVAFKGGWRLLVPDVAGVYFVHDLRGFLYIGRTGNLHTRYAQHYEASHNKLLTAALRHPLGVTQFSWIAMPVGDTIAAERHYISTLQPLCNDLSYTNHTS